MKNINRGFALIELLVATGVVTMVMVAVAAGVSVALKNSRYSSEKAQSVRLAQEVVEWMRNKRNVLGWKAFYETIDEDDPNRGAVGSETMYCLGELPESTEGFVGLGNVNDPDGCSMIAGSSYRRVVRITKISGEEMDVTVEVLWNDGGGDRSTQISASLAHWR